MNHLGLPQDPFDSDTQRPTHFSPILLSWSGSSVDQRGQISMAEKRRFLVDTVLPYLFELGNDLAIQVIEILQEPERFIKEIMIPEMIASDEEMLAERCRKQMLTYGADNMILDWFMRNLLNEYGTHKQMELRIKTIDILMMNRAALRELGLASPGMHEILGGLARITAYTEDSEPSPQIEEESSLSTRILGKLKSIVSLNIGGETKPTLTLLPESVRITLKNRGGMFEKKEILNMNSPDFKGLSVYLALKFFEQKPELQKKLLEKLLNAMSNSYDYTDINQIIRDFLPANSTDDMKPINGVKVAQVYRQGPDLFEETFESIATDLRHSAQTPCLLANAALIGLGPFAKAMTDGDDLIILYPKELDNEELVGYYIVNHNGNFNIEKLQLQHFERGNFVGIIDDTRNSGSTFDNVLSFVEDCTPSRVGQIRSVASSRSPE